MLLYKVSTRRYKFVTIETRTRVDTNAYKLQASLSDRIVVDGLGCHTALNFGVEANFASPLIARQWVEPNIL